MVGGGFLGKLGGMCGICWGVAQGRGVRVRWMTGGRKKRRRGGAGAREAGKRGGMRAAADLGKVAAR